jgi:hypothetical protein
MLQVYINTFNHTDSFAIYSYVDAAAAAAASVAAAAAAAAAAADDDDDAYALICTTHAACVCVGWGGYITSIPDLMVQTK